MFYVVVFMIVFENEKPFIVKYVLSKSNADRKSINIQAGDVLLKVNDESVDTKIDRNYYFTKPSLDRELKLQFNNAINKQGIRILQKITFLFLLN